MPTSTNTSIDVHALRQAVQTRDAATLEGLYADDAVIEIAGARTPPTTPAPLPRSAGLLLNDHWLARLHWSAAKETTSEDHAYVPVEQGHQHHLVCRNCGAV